eukprot:jgi/Galph1/3328/GphlegSOOS_G1972.1
MQPLYKDTPYERQAKQLSQQQQIQRNKARNSRNLEEWDRSKEDRILDQESVKLLHKENNGVTSTISFEEENEVPEEDIHLIEDSGDRTLFQTMGDLFCIIKETEHLERAWRSACLGAEDYTRECWNLINRYKATYSAVKTQISSTEQFIKDFEIEAPAARYRLIEAGVPATVEYGERLGNHSDILYVTRATRTFITARNVLEMKFYSKDEIYPYLTELLDALYKIERLKPDFEGKVKLKEWLQLMSRMKASDSLSDEQARQLAFDLESSFSAFERILGEA